MVAFLDHDPINPGHVLICPKPHYLDFDDLPANVLGEMNAITVQVYKAIKRCYLPDGISMMNNNGAFNDLGHYHLHVFPRYRGDGFRWISDGPGIKGREFLDRELKRLMNYV